MGNERSYQELFAQGITAQLEKLKEKEGKKGGWDDMDPFYILKRIKDKAKELESELFYPASGAPKLKKDINTKAVRRELADIANFAHMGIYNCNKLLKNKQ